MGEQKNKLTLNKRVEICRTKLKKIGLKGAKHLFCLKFKKYMPKKGDDIAKNKIDNLYYGKIKDEKFTKDLEEFVILMEHTFS